MKILHFITSLRTGGAERLMVELLPRLRDAGHDVELLVMDGTETPFTVSLKNKGIPVHALETGASAMHNPLLAFRLRKFLKEHQYDIIHTHNTPAQLLAATVAPRSANLITTEHNTTNRRRSSAIWRPVDLLMYGRYKAIVACGLETAESLAGYLPNLQPIIRVVPNGIDLDTFRGAKPAADIISRFHSKKIILMVAAFRPQKDHATMLKAFSLLPDDYALVLAGTGETLESIKALADESGAKNRIYFAGVRSDIPQLLAAADVAVLATHHEGLSLALVEAMASGTPLIATDVSGVRTTVGNGAILFPEADATALAHSITAICNNPTLRADLTDRAIKQAALFDISDTTENYLNVYSQIINQ